MSKYTKYRLYQKYETRGSQEAIPCYPNVFSIDGDGTMPLVIVEENSRDCGYTGETQPIYRWYTLPIDTYYYCDACQDAQYKWVNLPISQDWECVGTTKYYKQKKQVSVDGGSTWTDVTPPQYQRGAVYEYNSSSCGYITRTTSGTPYCEGYDKWVDVYTQVSSDGGNTWHTTETTPTLVEHDSYYCGYVGYRWTRTNSTLCIGAPQGYTQVEYIKQNSNYNAYINTGVIPFDNTNNSYTISVRLTSTFHSNLACASIISCETPEYPYYGLGYRYKCSETVDQLEFFGGYPNYTSSVIDNSDGTKTVMFQSTGNTSWTTSAPLTLLCSFSDTSYTTPYRYADAAIYSATIVKNGVTVRDFVPVKRDSDNAVGLYDTVNDVFYTSPNGNNLIAGPNV